MESIRDRLAVAGTQVRHRHNPALVGESLGQIEEEGGDLLVRVRFQGRPPAWEVIGDVELADAPVEESTLIAEGRFALTASLRRTLTSVQLAGELSELIYSLDMTNTDFMPHQFKPLLALLDSPSRGLLIADEVGLGKTIEAGLIWTELRFRTNASTLLVVCPAMLTEKWKLELARRFGTPARIMGAEDLLGWLDAPRQPSVASAIICSLQGMRPPRGWADDERPAQTPSAKLARKLKALEDTPVFDLVVIDEAHYLRNEETVSSQLGHLLRQTTDYLVLLSATPVNTRSEDLFNLARLVDPQQFQFPRQFEAVLEANRPLVRAANRLKASDCTAVEVIELLDEASEQWLLSGSASLSALRASLEEHVGDAPLAAPLRVDVTQRLERINLLGQVLSRSRKREVFEVRVQRKVSRIAALMSPAEQDFYRLVSEAIIDYANDHAGVEGFLLAMPQRQMASSMYAAARRWCGVENDDEGDAQMAWESLGDIDPTQARPVSSHVANRVRGRVDLAELRRQDSKFERLIELLRQQATLHPDAKVLIFSYFRPTLAYLKERLDAAGFPSTIVQGGDDKQGVIDGFQNDPSVRVLLASEVASEGVDLQFMRLMVNYDLPWNPMRVEQRIGRIDRIGQKADAISIFNLTYKDTIDDRILERLFNRLRLFEESIGSTEEVLGSEINALTRDLLSMKLTEEQQNHRIAAAEYAIAQKQRDLAQVEASEADLVGLGDYVRDRVIRARTRHRRISDADLLAHIEEFLKASAPGYQLHLDSGGALTGELRLPPELVARLESFREARHMPRSRLEGGHLERIVVCNHVDNSAATGKVELINQFHPLVRLIAEDRPALAQHLVHAVSLRTVDIGLNVTPGDYAFTSEFWSFSGVREENSVRALFVSLDDGLILPEEDAFDLLNAMRASGRDWVGVGEALPVTEVVVDRLELARRKLLGLYRRDRDTHHAENADRARIQRQSVLQDLERRGQSLESRIAADRVAGRKGLEKANLAQLVRLRQQADVKLERIKARETLRCDRNTLVEGLLRVVP